MHLKWKIVAKTCITFSMILQGICYSEVSAEAATKNQHGAFDYWPVHSDSKSENFGGQWFRISGAWDGKELKADSIQLRLPEKELARGQISGQIRQLNLASNRLIIGPYSVEWNDKTEFDRINKAEMLVGMTLKVSGKMTGPKTFVARTIARESSPFAVASTLQITGLSSSSFEREDGFHEFSVLDIPVATPQNGYNIVKSLVRRLDVRRPDDQFKFNLFGKPVTIGGEYDLNPGVRDNTDLDFNNSDESVRLDQELKLEAFYPISQFTAVFLSFKGITQSRFNIDNDSVDRTTVELARDETWIYFDRLWGTGFGLQMGNQNVTEVREWWWDKDLDAVRLYYNHGALHFELASGKQLAETTLNGLDPRENKIVRLMGMGSWMWRSKQRLEYYFLQQWDQSFQEDIGTVVNRVNRDIYDDDIAWFGARAIGEIGLGDYGSLNYWADTAGVHGDETVYKYETINGGQAEVTAKHQNKVDGWAVDIGAFWTLPFKHEPTFTFSYAHGSGDDHPNDGHNSTFRQTGIQRNKWRFNGVNRFRIYGEFLRPELSNMDILTGAFGLKMLNNSSLELVYHKYDQVEAIDDIRNSNLNVDPNGTNKDIGQELDLVLNFREWKKLELGVTAAVFDPGSAFGKDHNDLAYSIFFDVNYNF